MRRHAYNGQSITECLAILVVPGQSLEKVGGGLIHRLWHAQTHRTTISMSTTPEMIIAQNTLKALHQCPAMPREALAIHTYISTYLCK